MATFGTFVSGQVLTAAELNTAGAWQSYTPTFTQSATITKTVNWARYTELNKWVQGSVKMTASSAGTANNKVLVGLPVNASTNNFIIGSMVFYNDSETNKYRWTGLNAFFETASTMSFTPVTSGGTNATLSEDDKRFGQNYLAGGSQTGLTIASGDIIWIQFAYEAA